MEVIYFPEIRNDELVYSCLARFYVYSGFTHYRYAADILCGKVNIKIDKEFVKGLKPEIVQILTQNMTWEEVIEKHTMYPLHGRFLTNEKREIAHKALMKMEGDYSKLFGIPWSAKDEHKTLKYCPICAQEDREEYGDAFWHRVHQIRMINLCAKHGCYLTDSNVLCDSHAELDLIAAEEVIPEKSNVKYCKNPIELELAKYMAEVFLEPVNSNASHLKNFLRHKLVGTPYTSARGEHCYFTKLWDDLQRFYNSFPDISEFKAKHVQTILGGQRKSFRDICIVAMFLQIPPSELARMETPEQTPEEIFDMKVSEMLRKGMNCRSIADKLDVPKNIVRLSTKIMQTPPKKYVHGAVGISTIDYSDMDDEMIDIVQDVVQKFMGCNGEKPRRVSYYSIAKELQFPVHRLYKMPKCASEIKIHQESDEYYYARKLRWGIEMLEKKGEPIKYWTLSRACKMEKVQLNLYTPYMRELGWPESADVVEDIMRYRNRSQ